MGKLVITQFNNRICSVFFDDAGKAAELLVEPEDMGLRLGDIYVGFVQQIVKNINAAFIEIADKTVCYCPLNEKTEYIFGPHGGKDQLCAGDYVLVQIEKEPIKTKQPAVTGALQFTGKYLVLLHGLKELRISKKITEKAETTRLRQALEEFKNESYGFIVRTNAKNADEATLKDEAKRLVSQYEALLATGIHKAKGTLLFKGQPGYVDFLRDLPEDGLTEVVTDLPEVYETLCGYCEDFQREDRQKLRFYEDTTLSLSALHSLQRVWKEATARKVLLKSGASLIIEPTETLTVIDVNTGKAISKKKAGDEVFYKINEEAARTCMEQIRLRNLSGMILIDFINMEAPEYNERLLAYLRELAAGDRIPTSVVDMTGLGLVELTRKKVRKPLHEQIFYKEPPQE